jgi:TolB-like protein
LKVKKILALIFLLFGVTCCAATHVAVQEPEPVQIKKRTPRYSSPEKALDYLGRALSQELQSLAVRRKNKAKPMVIAVSDFVTAEKKVTRLGRYVSDKLTPYFARSKQFSVLERALIDKVFEEHKFQTSPFVDEDSTQEFGKLLGAEAIIAGSLSELSDAFYINAKAIGVTQGNIMTSVDVEIKRSDKLAALYHTDLPGLNNKKIKTRKFSAQGIGIPSAKHKNPNVARALAFRAAKGDAMRNLVEQIQAVQITSDTTIKDMVTQDDDIRIQLNSSLQGARVINQRQLPDGTVEVEMEVELTEEFLKALYSN